MAKVKSFDRLRAIGEVTKLAFPQHHRLRISERIAVIKAQHAKFREQRIEGFNFRLTFADIIERRVFSLVRLIDQHRVGAGSVAEHCEHPIGCSRRSGRAGGLLGAELYQGLTAFGMAVPHAEAVAAGQQPSGDGAAEQARSKQSNGHVSQLA